MTKRCSKCGLVKPVEEFSRCKKNKDGRQYRCKACKNAHYAENREECKEQSRKYCEDNREKIKERNRKWRAANPDKIAALGREYREANREKIAEYQRKYHADNREGHNAQMREYYRANREERKDRVREYAAAQPGGVYKLTCVPTGEFYIGSAGNLQHRCSQHFGQLRSGNHDNPTIRELSKTYTSDDFKFEPLVYCDREEAYYYEQKLIELKPCCNIHNVDGSRR